MRKKHIEINKLNNFTPSINFISPNETQQNQIKGIMTRSKTPFYPQAAYARRNKRSAPQ